MVTRCYFCGGSTALDYVTVENGWGESRALVENVPAQVCQQCGEEYFDAATCRVLDQLRQHPPRAKRIVQLPVYAYQEAG